MIFWIPGYQGFDPSPTPKWPLTNVTFILFITSASFLGLWVLFWAITIFAIKKLPKKELNETDKCYIHMLYLIILMPIILTFGVSGTYTFANNIKMNEIVEVKEVQIIDKSTKSILVNDAFVWFNDDNKTNSSFADFLSDDKDNQKLIGKSAKVDFITQEYKVIKTMNILYEQMSKAFYGELNIRYIKN